MWPDIAKRAKERVGATVKKYKGLRGHSTRILVPVQLARTGI